MMKILLKEFFYVSIKGCSNNLNPFPGSDTWLLLAEYIKNRLDTKKKKKIILFILTALVVIRVDG